MESPVIKLKYKTVGGFEFASLIQKLANVQTDNKSAGHINHIVQEVGRARDAIHAQYMKDIREVYARRTEDGKIDISENEPGDEQGFKIAEGKDEEFKKAQDEFGEQMIDIKWKPLTPSTLKDVQISAKEMNLLGELYTEQEGPGVPQFSNVQAMKRK